MAARVHFADERRGRATPPRKALRDAPLFLRVDLSIVRWWVRQLNSVSSLRAVVLATTSYRRTADVSLVLWFIFLAALPELGLPYLWICVGNLLAVLLLQWLAQVPRPMDYEPVWAIRGASDRDLWGFPCVDSHMAVVVLLPVFEHCASSIARLAMLVLVVWLAISRLCVASRFLSQIVGSWLTGAAGVVLGNHGHWLVQASRLPRGYNTVALVALIALVICVMGQWIENNDSRMLGVPKDEFLRVFASILHSDAPSAAAIAATTRHSTSLPSLSSESEADSEQAAQIAQSKRDSFYYLMRAMRSRARAV